MLQLLVVQLLHYRALYSMKHFNCGTWRTSGLVCTAGQPTPTPLQATLFGGLDVF